MPYSKIELVLADLGNETDAATIASGQRVFNAGYNWFVVVVTATKIKRKQFLCAAVAWSNTIKFFPTPKLVFLGDYHCALPKARSGCRQDLTHRLVGTIGFENSVFGAEL